MRIEHRQQGQADAAGFSGRHDSSRHLPGVGVGRSVCVVMKIVEFADATEAAFEHLDVSLGRDGLELPRAHAMGQTIHRLPPAPEVVRRVAAHLGETGHGALERMTVEVTQRGNEDGVAFVPGLRRYARLQ